MGREFTHGTVDSSPIKEFEGIVTSLSELPVTFSSVLLATKTLALMNG